MGLEAPVAWKTCTFGLTKKLPYQDSSFTKNYELYCDLLEAFLFQMNRDNGGNSIDLILVGQCPLSLIKQYESTVFLFMTSDNACIIGFFSA